MEQMIDAMNAGTGAIMHAIAVAKDAANVGKLFYFALFRKKQFDRIW